MAERFESYLKKREVILWSGRPARILWRRRDRHIRLGGAAMATFTGLVVVGFTHADGFPVLPLVLPVLLFGLPGTYLVIGHAIQSQRVRAKTSYCVTNQRVLIHTEWPEKRKSEWLVSHVREVLVEPEGNGLRTVVFGRRPSPRNRHEWTQLVAWPGRAPVPVPEFVGLTEDEAERVSQVLLGARDALLPPSRRKRRACNDIRP